jgi:hypothetical protein
MQYGQIAPQVCLDERGSRTLRPAANNLVTVKLLPGQIFHLLLNAYPVQALKILAKRAALLYGALVETTRTLTNQGEY